MKEYIQLYKKQNNRYYTINKPNPPLWHLNYFLENDYRSYKTDMLTRKLNFYNVTYIYNDFQNKLLYMGFGDWLIDSEIDGPSDEEFLNYLNEANSCKMSIDNHLEFR